jgi:hypothetical protein
MDLANSFQGRGSRVTIRGCYNKLIPYALLLSRLYRRRRIEKKIENVLGEDQFGFRRGKGTRNVIGMMRIIAELTLEIDEKLCTCFKD